MIKEVSPMPFGQKKLCQVYFIEYNQQIGNQLDIRIKEPLLKLQL